jgi:hypothetical protein
VPKSVTSGVNSLRCNFECILSIPSGFVQREGGMKAIVITAIAFVNDARQFASSFSKLQFYYLSVPLDGTLSLSRLHHLIADVQENTLIHMCTNCCRSTMRRSKFRSTEFRFRS